MNESYESSKRMPQEAQGAYSWISSWMQCVLQRERESLKMMMSRVSSDMRDEIVTDDASRNPTCNRVMKRNHNNITTIRQEYNNTLQSRKGKTNPKISLNLCSPVASLSISSFHFAWCLNMSLTKLCIISWGNESHLNTCRFIWYCLFNARVTLIILSIHASCIQGSVTPLFYLISVIVFYLKHSCDTELWHRNTETLLVQPAKKKKTSTTTFDWNNTRISVEHTTFWLQVSLQVNTRGQMKTSLGNGSCSLLVSWAVFLR